jgi:hypothetical protein
VELLERRVDVLPCVRPHGGDVDARVLERPDGEAFYVPCEDLLYVYTPPRADRVDGATRMIDDTDDPDES